MALPRNPRDLLDMLRRLEDRVRRLELRPAGTGGGGEVEHGFSITGPLYDLGGAYISPWVARHDCTLTEFYTEGPHTGTCDVYWNVQGVYVDNTDCPITLAADDLVRIELDPDAGSETITGMFKIVG